MRKIVTSSVAALAALSTLATAIPAVARDHDGDGDERGEWHRGHDRDGRRDRDDRRDWGRSHNRGHHNGWRGRDGRNWAYYGGNYGYDGYDGRWRVGDRYP